MPECHRIIGSIEHFYGHLEIKSCGSLGLCSVALKGDVAIFLHVGLAGFMIYCGDADMAFQEWK